VSGAAAGLSNAAAGGGLNDATATGSPGCGLVTISWASRGQNLGATFELALVTAGAGLAGVAARLAAGGASCEIKAAPP